MERFERAVITRGMTVFCRVNFTADAERVAMSLGATELIIFGNPKIGTLLLQENQRVGLELPLKVLVWSTHDGDTNLEFHDPYELLGEYCIGDPETLLKMRKILLRMAQEATGEAI
jgi:uncharacterized protein (DUF302 family)